MKQQQSRDRFIFLFNENMTVGPNTRLNDLFKIVLQYDLKEKFLFCTLSLIIRIFKIIYCVLWHYYDERCSPESWRSLLTSLLAENNRSEGAF